MYVHRYKESVIPKRKFTYDVSFTFFQQEDGEERGIMEFFTSFDETFTIDYSKVRKATLVTKFNQHDKIIIHGWKVRRRSFIPLFLTICSEKTHNTLLNVRAYVDLMFFRLIDEQFVKDKLARLMKACYWRSMLNGNPKDPIDYAFLAISSVNTSIFADLNMLTEYTGESLKAASELMDDIDRILSVTEEGEMFHSAPVDKWFGPISDIVTKYGSLNAYVPNLIDPETSDLKIPVTDKSIFPDKDLRLEITDYDLLKKLQDVVRLYFSWMIHPKENFETQVFDHIQKEKLMDVLSSTYERKVTNISFRCSLNGEIVLSISFQKGKKKTMYIDVYSFSLLMFE